MMDAINILLFPHFEVLDVFGPAEVLHRSGRFSLHYCSLEGGAVCSAQGAVVQTEKLSCVPDGILLIPGGPGTRQLVSDEEFLRQLIIYATDAPWVLSVCTGSALLAKTGLLDNRHATSNKRAFAWVASQSDKVIWEQTARWITDGKFYTSAGVSAGTDMALAFVADRFGKEEAIRVAEDIEYCTAESYFRS